MVSYCCVKGCNNNSNKEKKKKNSNSVISFHAFPSNPEVKQKWLKAIGRPNWEPPKHARICSAHFTYEQITHESCRTRIKDDMSPVQNLPPNSNFEASHIEVCRICLMTDVKMYSLQDSVLKTCMESIIALNENIHIDGLPQFVCYECAAQLMNCYKLIEKSMTAQALLLDIFARNSLISKNLIVGQNRRQFNLISSLNTKNTTMCNIFNFRYDYENNCSVLIDSDFISNPTESNDEDTTHEAINPIKFTKNNGKDDDDFKNNLYNNDEGSLIVNNEVTTHNLNLSNTETCELKNVLLPVKIEAHDENKMNDNDDDSNSMSDVNDASIENLYDDDYKVENDVKNQCDSKMKVTSLVIEKPKTKSKRKIDGLTPDEVSMLKYFRIERLSLKEQIEYWDNPNKRLLNSKTLYTCEKCDKVFAHVNPYKSHLSRHDPKHGKFECPVCKIRFKSEPLMASHANRSHGKRFHCRNCSKIFSKVGVAKKHHRWHIGHLYKCESCQFASKHESALGQHVRRQHAREHACQYCGRAFVSGKGLQLHCATVHTEMPETENEESFSCEQCDVTFLSEGARRVHLLTSVQHKKRPNLCDATSPNDWIQTSCSRCGDQFKSVSELRAHRRAEHPQPRPRNKTTWRLPDDSYPTKCEHCGENVNSRAEHWQHVRREHPKEKCSYRAVINAVCETCGKGFQNSTKLQLHELRHGSPSVGCPQCPRMFYDKYALGRHAAVHAPQRPYTCQHCGKAFKLKCHLERHSRVHTGVTPYECNMCGKKFKYSTSVNLHVRTVHYKLPHPPRKKKCRPTRNIDTEITK